MKKHFSADAPKNIPPKAPVRAPVKKQISRSANNNCACGGGCPRCAANAPPGVSRGIEAKRGRGGPLPDHARQVMERGFGQSFENVRVHTGPDAVGLAREVRARAFTTGSDIFFNRNQFNPSTSEGKHLLAHELAHVAQGEGDSRLVQRAPLCEVDGTCVELSDISNEELVSVNPILLSDQDLDLFIRETRRRRQEFGEVTSEMTESLLQAQIMAGEEQIDRTRATAPPPGPASTAESGFNLETGEPIILPEEGPLLGEELRPEPTPAPTPTTVPTTAGSPTLTSIGAARGNVSVSVKSQREVMFPNPKVIGVFPIKRKGGERKELFGPLIALGRERIKLEEKTIPALEKELEKAKKTKDKKQKREDDLKAKGEKGAKKLPGAEKARKKAEATVKKAEENLKSAKERMKQILLDLKTEATKLKPKVKTALTTRRDTAQKEFDDLKAKIKEIEETVKDLDPKKNKKAIKAKNKDKKKKEKARDKALASLTKWKGALTALDTEPMTVAQKQQAFKVTVKRGKDTLKTTLNPVGPNFNVDRPFGFFGGGKTIISDKVVDEAITELFAHLPEAERKVEVENAKKILATFKSNEGRADSINTWDRARLTLGPGLAAFGVLQLVFKSLKKEDPDKFQELVGQYGVDITMAKNPKFVVTVPPASAALPADVLLDPNSPFTTPPKPGDKLTGVDALEYIVRDPVLLAVLRLAGQDEAMQRAMVRVTGKTSLKKAKDFTLNFKKVKWTNPDSGKVEKKNFSIPWADIMNEITPNGGDYLNATRAALADEAHGTGNTGGGTDAAKPKYLELIKREGVADPENYKALSQDALKELAATVAAIVPSRRRSVFRAEFGTLGEELFPAPKKKSKKKKE